MENEVTRMLPLMVTDKEVVKRHCPKCEMIVFGKNRYKSIDGAAQAIRDHWEYCGKSEKDVTKT